MKLTFFLSFILTLLSTTTTTISLPNPNLNPNQKSPSFLCDCYIPSASDPETFFTHYKFWDFRNVALPSDLETTQTNPHDPSTTFHTYPLTKTIFDRDWRAQNWSREATPIGPVPIVNTDRNVFLLKDPSSGQLAPKSSFLVLRTTRFADHASTAELEGTFGFVYHCSLRVRMRMLSREGILRVADNTNPRKRPPPPASSSGIPKGTCAGIFTYRSAQCESDIEILTSEDPHTIHYANQPDYDPVTDKVISGASSVVNLSTPWTDWVTHRLDWHSGSSVWFADGQVRANLSYSVPDQPSYVAMNLWSDGGVWSGEMRVGESVFMAIEWIELVYNVSSGGGLQGPIRDRPGQRVRHRRPSVDLPSMRGDTVDRPSAMEVSVSRAEVKRQTGKTRIAGCQQPC
ncbi:concanavalin A-like lectin/glucanase [Aspergillus ellipticus CBS 707.79]|uniref:Concanavalin A-like lectin/glucanase n=1 Tax=Aspergillus ellipticus CBS 707.79 TaxID=1448320 RepID=A0A319DKS1_9EURO|nr:concanavalin A-like lectin/glucanase [Aspergillus ellipticus CBS 707.79]